MIAPQPKRVMIQMGHGTDADGDATAAAREAIRNAGQTAVMRMFVSLGLEPARAELRVGLGLPLPEAVDTDALRAELASGPFGSVVITVSQGGLSISDPEGGPDHITAAAALETFVPDAGGDWHQSND